MAFGQKPKAMTDAWPHPWFGTQRQHDKMLRQLAKERGIKLP
jgi:hypothetical protein